MLGLGASNPSQRIERLRFITFLIGIIFACAPIGVASAQEAGTTATIIEKGGLFAEWKDGSWTLETSNGDDLMTHFLYWDRKEDQSPPAESDETPNEYDRVSLDFE